MVHRSWYTYHGDRRVVLQRLGYRDHGVTENMVLHRSWCYRDHGVTEIMVLQRSWCYIDHGVTEIMVLQRSWCHIDHGVTEIMVSGPRKGYYGTCVCGDCGK